MPTRTLRILLVSIAVLFLNFAALAQVPDPVTATEAPVPGAGHHYIGIGAETVNPADGSLSFDLPFEPAAGRQLSFTFGIRFSGTEQFYLSNLIPPASGPHLAWTPNWYPAGQAPWQVGAWSYDLPILTGLGSVYQEQYIPDYGSCPPCNYKQNLCYGSDQYVFRGLDAKQESLPIATMRTGPDNNTDICPHVDKVSPGDNTHGILATIQGNGLEPPVAVVDASGTTYQFPGGSDYGPPTNAPLAFGFLASSITDRNGNKITLDANGKGYKDSTGRDAVTWTGIGHSGDQITVAGLGGNATIQWTTTRVTYPETGQNVGGSGTCDLLSQGPTGSLSVISEIDLPNGQNYRFLYDGTYGKVSKIYFPGGGYVRYLWGLNHLAKTTHVAWSVPPLGGNPPSYLDCYFAFDVPAITDRYVSYDGSSEVLHQHFQYSTNSSGSPWKQTTVTTTDLLTGQSSQTVYGYDPGLPDRPVFVQGGYINMIPVETSVVYKNGAGSTTYKTVNKTWKSPHALL